MGGGLSGPPGSQQDTALDARWRASTAAGGGPTGRGGAGTDSCGAAPRAGRREGPWPEPPPPPSSPPIAFPRGRSSVRRPPRTQNLKTARRTGGGGQREVGHGDRRVAASGWETTPCCPSSDAGTRDFSLTVKVCLSPEVENQSFLSTPAWPIRTRSSSGRRGCHDSEPTGVPRVSEPTRRPRRRPRPEVLTAGPEEGVALTMQPARRPAPPAPALQPASPCAFPNSAVSSSDLDPVCALETSLDPEPRTCSGCSSWDDENL